MRRVVVQMELKEDSQIQFIFSSEKIHLIMLSHLLLLLPLQHQWGLLHAAYNELFFYFNL